MSWNGTGLIQGTEWDSGPQTFPLTIGGGLRPFNRTVQWQGLKAPNFVIGDDFIHSATLLSGTPSQATNLSSAASIKARLVMNDNSSALTDAVTLNSGDVDADWSQGIVMISMGQSITEGARAEFNKLGLAQLEIEATLGASKFTWFAPVKVIPGYIE